MSTTNSTSSRWAMLALFVPGLLVALGAAAATAHGLFEVAVASGVPGEIAWIYPLITDGLAIVAYVATSRLAPKGRRYAWSVVILAAGLSGLAQASFLAGGVTTPPGATGATADGLLRFGVGAWPAIAAAIVAHLLFMLATDHRLDAPDVGVGTAGETSSPLAERSALSTSVVQPGRVHSPDVQPQAVHSGAVQPRPLDASGSSAVDGRTAAPAEAVQPEPSRDDHASEVKPERPPVQPPSPKRDRARAAARKHQALHHTLPTVDELMKLADVSRGTAGTALQELREQPAHLHVITELNTTQANS